MHYYTALLNFCFIPLFKIRRRNKSFNEKLCRLNFTSSQKLHIVVRIPWFLEYLDNRIMDDRGSAIYKSP